MIALEWPTRLRERGIVMMAPGVRPVDAMIIDQMTTGAKATGLGADEIAQQTRAVERHVLRDPRSEAEGHAAVHGRERGLLARSHELGRAEAGLRESKLPILVLQGDEDIQVRKDADFELLKSRAGTSGGRVTYRSFAGLNHLFMKVEHRLDRGGVWDPRDTSIRRSSPRSRIGSSCVDGQGGRGFACRSPL